MRHRCRFSSPDDLAAYDEGYRLGQSDEQVNLPHVEEREALARQFVTLIGVLDGLQEQNAKLRQKR